ncbi:hypothetical protein QCD60_17515 [Pokkaliibacter sp. MBI-7]|uniref:hypothetical protein n=1 Tax=Pokkaliibacter sp. MBI-7 TaxID=3040600 RepID=UPI00244AE075|nr:hypothetical protein [Pokkaliibacter sp. MBI-7]MDH2434360.1 hypothetical protein [Pokkaliibacter sp. MBI-7]
MKLISLVWMTGGAVAGAAAFLVAQLVCWMDEAPTIELVIHNLTASPVSRVEFVSSGMSSTVTMTAPSNPLRLVLPLYGDSGYTLRVVLADGQHCLSTGSYISAGDHLSQGIDSTCLTAP